MPTGAGTSRTTTTTNNNQHYQQPTTNNQQPTSTTTTTNNQQYSQLPPSCPIWCRSLIADLKRFAGAQLTPERRTDDSGGDGGRVGRRGRYQ